MVLSAVFITDLKGKVIISRNYRGDIPMEISEKFTTYVQETNEFNTRPVFTIDGVTFVYVQHNNLYLLTITKRNSNIALMLMYLYRIVSGNIYYIKIYMHMLRSYLSHMTSLHGHIYNEMLYISI